MMGWRGRLAVLLIYTALTTRPATGRRSCGPMDFDWSDPEVTTPIPSDCSDMNLFNARIGDDGAKALALALMNTDAEIESLNLRDNRIGDDGAAALAKALAQNKHVQFLQLRGNDLGDKGAIALAGALHTNTVLTDVYLTWLDIGDDGAVAIADALGNNPDSNVRVLHLSWNKIGTARRATPPPHRSPLFGGPQAHRICVHRGRRGGAACAQSSGCALLGLQHTQQQKTPMLSPN